MQLDKLSHLKAEVKDITLVMGDTIKVTLENAETANELVDSSKDALETSASFQMDATVLRRTMQLRNIKVNTHTMT